MNSVSAIQIYPVHLVDSTQRQELSAVDFFFANGFKLSKIIALSAAQDLSLNNQTGLVLSNLLLPDSFLAKSEPDQTTDITEITSPLSKYNTTWYDSSAVRTVWDGLYWRVSAVNQAVSAALVSQENFTFTFDKTAVRVNNDNHLYLSFSGSGVYLSPLDGSSNQVFSYLLGKNTICLFPTTANYTSAIKWNNNILVVSAIGNLSGTSLSSLQLGLVSQNEILNPLNSLSSVAASYKTNPTTYQQELELDDKTYQSQFYQNYLFQFPLNTLQVENGLANFSVKFHPLKNHQTTQGQYAKEPSTIEMASNTRRIYKGIFTGPPSNEGWDKVYLGYVANTTTIKLLADQYNEFQFSPTTDDTYLSVAGFIENGATAASIPYIADRVYVRKIDYTDQAVNFPTPSFDRLDGNWLCSWLSGNDTQKIWMDRFYNAGYFSASTSAIDLFGLIEKTDSTKDYIWDQPSTLKLEKGVSYQYFHTGSKTSKELLKLIEIDPSNVLGTKILHFNQWNTDSILDASPHQQVGYKVNEIGSSTENYLSLDGNLHVSIPPKENLLLESDFTVNFWIHSENWDSIEGGQIFGNFDRSGYGLINYSTVQAPLFTLLENRESKTYTLNYKLGVASTNILSGGSFEFIQRLPDLSYWVIDSQTKRAFWFDAFQNLITYKDIPLYGVHQVLADIDSNLYILDRTNYQYIKIDYNTTEITSYYAPNWTKSLSIDRNQNILYSNGIYSLVTLDNILWEVVNNNLYRSTLSEIGVVINKQFVAVLGPCFGMAADATDHLYFLLSGSKVAKLNTATYQFKYSQVVGQVNESTERYLGIIRSPTPNTCQASIQEILVLVDNITKEVFLLDEEGSLIYYLNLINIPATQESNNDTIPDFRLNGDFTGYNVLRQLTVSSGLRWKIKSLYETTPKTLNAVGDNVAPGWHMLSLVLDRYTNTAKSYMNGVLVSTKTGVSGVDFVYKSPLLIGATTVQNNTLNEVLGLENVSKFQGRFADLRIYNKPFAADIIKQLYWDSPVITVAPSDLLWHMYTQERNYLEEIQHWFLLNPPGTKSKYFNINIYNFNGAADIKARIEESIRKYIYKIAPQHTQLYKIQWI